MWKDLRGPICRRVDCWVSFWTCQIQMLWVGGPIYQPKTFGIQDASVKLWSMTWISPFPLPFQKCDTLQLPSTSAPPLLFFLSWFFSTFPLPPHPSFPSSLLIRLGSVSTYPGSSAGGVPQGWSPFAPGCLMLSRCGWTSAPAQSSLPIIKHPGWVPGQGCGPNQTQCLHGPPRTLQMGEKD